MLKQLIAGFALALAGTGIAASAAADVVPAKVDTFRDWAVGCDNGLACQAVALMPQASPEGSLAMVLSRGAGVNGIFAIEMSGFTSKSDRYRVVIDGKIADTGTIPVGSDTIRVTGADAMKLARAMARGRVLRLIDGAGTDLGLASLTGSTAAFRYTDAAQGRAGSRGAIIATGPKTPGARKVVLPVITAKKISPSGVLPDAAALVTLSENSPCTAQRFGPTQDTAYSLGTGANGPQALVLLNCGSGAYNFSVGAYVSQQDANGKWSFALAKFDYPPAGLAENTGIPLLVNAEWNEAKQRLGAYSKSRGIGDCGRSEGYVWDGAMFRLTDAAAMEPCRGSLDWIPVWRAEVKLVD